MSKNGKKITLIKARPGRGYSTKRCTVVLQRDILAELERLRTAGMKVSSSTTAMFAKNLIRISDKDEYNTNMTSGKTLNFNHQIY